jgi:hypothetical protein
MKYEKWYYSPSIFGDGAQVFLIKIGEKIVAWKWEGKGSYIAFSVNSSPIEDWNDLEEDDIWSDLTFDQKKLMIGDIFGNMEKSR